MNGELRKHTFLSYREVGFREPRENSSFGRVGGNGSDFGNGRIRLQGTGRVKPGQVRRKGCPENSDYGKKGKNEERLAGRIKVGIERPLSERRIQWAGKGGEKHGWRRRR